MFNIKKVESKIKLISKIILIIGFVAAFLGLCYIISSIITEEYLYLYTGIGLILSIIPCTVSYVMIYGYGQLIENTSTMVELAKDSKQEAMKPKTDALKINSNDFVPFNNDN